MDPWACWLLTLWGVGCSGKAAPVVPPTPPPLLTWKSSGNPGLPLCSSTVKTDCLTTYTVMQDGVVIGENIPASSLQYIVGTLPPSGSHTYQLVINGEDQSGKAIASPPAVATVKIP